MKITNIEFEEAYKNIDYQKIMKAACKKYKTYLSVEILENCRLHGLWKCLIYHKNNNNNVKFTTSLFNYVTWECQKEIEKNRKNKQIAQLDTNLCIISIERETNIDHIKECINKLTKDEQILIKSRYFDGKTLQEIGNNHKISKETVRQRINKAIKRLKQICK